MPFRAKSATLILLMGFSLARGTIASDLEGSVWRLLNITSMDDSVAIPDDSNNYTLGFDIEDRATIKADCNHGTASWSSESAGQLVFGPIAATRALCPPESLYQLYLAQFPWVRSYTMSEGHLFLATMADGSIIEFEPLPPVVASVFGEKIHAADVEELQSLVVTRVFDRYASAQHIEVEDSEVLTFLDNMRRGMDDQGLIAEDDLTPEELLQAEAMRREMAYAVIRQWKINRALYKAYGGRIIYQQLGPEPLDAYRRYFKERLAAGDFTIDDPVMAEQFWSYFTDESRHDFMESGGPDAVRAFATPPWEIAR